MEILVVVGLIIIVGSIYHDFAVWMGWRTNNYDSNK